MRSQRPACRLRRPQGGEFSVDGFDLQAIGDVVDAGQQRGDAHEGIISSSQMRAHARPGPVLGSCRQARPDGIESDIPGCCEKVPFIQDDRSEPPLKQVPGPLLAPVDERGLAPMRLTERAGQSALVRGGRHDVYVVWHQAVDPHLHATAINLFPEDGQVSPLIAWGDEDRGPAIAALSDMVGQAGHDCSRESRHINNL